MTKIINNIKLQFFLFKLHKLHKYTINIRMTSRNNEFEFLNYYNKISSHKRYLLIFCFNYSIYFKDLNSKRYIIVNNQLYSSSSFLYKTYKLLFLNHKIQNEYNL